MISVENFTNFPHAVYLTPPLREYSLKLGNIGWDRDSDVNKDWTCKDKDKDLTHKDQDKDKDFSHS